VWKAILFILPTGGSEALIIIAAILLGWVLPITPVQILWINMITAVTLGLALSFEPMESGVMQRPPSKPGTPLFSALLIWRFIFVSLLIMTGGFGFFLWARETQASLEVARTITVNVLVIGEIAYLFNSRKILGTVLNWKGLFGNPAVLISIVVVLMFQLLFTYVPWMQRIFGTAALNLNQWFYIILFGLTLFLLVEGEKYLVRKYQASSSYKIMRTK
jgi:magnesium-transporting ATPase (P-type)